MQELDKAAMGRRIRQIRLGAGLRQWELAKVLGTTQSAVHKYEHGVVPEPRRLIELARVGETSIEWILTGEHWENGSPEQRRLSPDVLDTASLLQEFGGEARARVDEALSVMREAVAALASAGEAERESAGAARAAGGLEDHGARTLELLETAWRLQCRVLDRVADAVRSRLEAGGDAGPGEAGRSRNAGS